MKSREIILRLAYWKILKMQEFDSEAISTETMLECAGKTLAAYAGTCLSTNDQHCINNLQNWVIEAKDFLRSESR